MYIANVLSCMVVLSVTVLTKTKQNKKNMTFPNMGVNHFIIPHGALLLNQDVSVDLCKYSMQKNSYLGYCWNGKLFSVFYHPGIVFLCKVNFFFFLNVQVSVTLKVVIMQCNATHPPGLQTVQEQPVALELHVTGKCEMIDVNSQRWRGKLKRRTQAAWLHTWT